MHIIRSLRGSGFPHFLVAALLAVIIGGTVAGGWYVYSHQPKAVQQATTASSGHTQSSASPAASSPTAVATTIQLKQAISTMYPFVISGKAPAAQFVDHLDLTNAPIWKGAGYDFATIPSTTSTISMIVWPPSPAAGQQPAPLSSTDWQVVNDYVDQQLHAMHYAKQADDSLAWRYQYGVETYLSGNVICRKDQDGKNEISITCADFSAYAGTSAADKPFMDAYYQANPATRSNGGVVVNTPSISPSNTAGYQIADVIIAAAHSYFYQKGGVWHYVYSAQLPLTCDFSKYPEARPAFLGQPCVSMSGADTVK